MFRIDEILARFPDAKVMYMLRDPRAVVASYRDWKYQGCYDFENDPEGREKYLKDHERTRKSYHHVIIALLWKGTYRAATAALAKHGPDRIRVQSYEQLCLDPETQTRELLTFFGLDPSRGSTEVPVLNSSYIGHERGKGFVTSGIDRWREVLTQAEISMIESIVAASLSEAGFEAVRRGGTLTLLSGYASLALALPRIIHANRARLGNLPAYAARRASAVLGRAGRT